MSFVPKLSTWCSYCITPTAFGLSSSPCPDHRGSDGSPIEYVGRDTYSPSEWVLHVVGGRYTSWRGGVCVCTGYDPRQGFWMQYIETGERVNVSERAIDRTYHRVTMTPAAWEVLGMMVKLGRVPTDEEAPWWNVPACAERLRQNGFIDASGVITDDGRRALVDMEKS